VVKSDKTPSLLLIQRHVKSLNPVYLPLGQIRRPEYFICRFESNGSIPYYGAHRYIHVCVEIILLRCHNIIIIERGIKRFKSADRILEICLIRPSSKYADSNFWRATVPVETRCTWLPHPNADCYCVSCVMQLKGKVCYMHFPVLTCSAILVLGWLNSKSTSEAMIR
jgi:hypothetical protein